MTPWLVLTAFTAAINLCLFILVRGRWDRLVPALFMAAVVGAVIGNAVGDRTDMGPRIGDYHVAVASVTAQLAMLATTLLAVLLQARRTA